MRWFVAIVIIWLAIVALVVSLAAKPLELPLQIDAQSPGVWPRYAAARDPDLVCIHVLTPDVIRRRAREVSQT